MQYTGRTSSHNNKMSSEKLLMEDVDFEDQSSFKTEYDERPSPRAWKVSTVILAITTVIFAATTTAPYIRQVPSREKGYNTEWSKQQFFLER
jgi:hypothetical protein